MPNSAETFMPDNSESDTSVSEIAVACNRVYLIGWTVAQRLGDLTLACEGDTFCAFLAAFDLGP